MIKVRIPIIFLSLIVTIVAPHSAFGQASVDAANLAFADSVTPADLVDTDLGQGLAFSKFCNYVAARTGAEDVTAFAKITDEQLLSTIERVVGAFGQHERIKSIRVALYLAGGMPGAAFVDVEGTAYLVVSNDAVDQMRTAAGGGEDVLIAFLAHELSHIFRQSWGQNGSNQESSASLPAAALDRLRANLASARQTTEINADRNSGQVAQSLGVSIDDAVKAVELFADEEGNSIYAPMAERKRHLEEGWMMGCRSNPDNCAEASFDSAELRRRAQNNIVVGTLDLPDETSDKFQSAFGEVFYEILSAAAQSHFQKRTSVIQGIDLKRIAFVPARLPSDINSALADEAYLFGQQFDVVGIINSDVDWDRSALALDIDSQFFIIGDETENQTYFDEYSRVEDTYQSPRRYAQRGQISTRWGNLAALAKAIELIEEIDGGGNATTVEQTKETIRQLIGLAVLDLRCPAPNQSDEMVSWIQNNSRTAGYLTIDLDELCGF